MAWILPYGIGLSLNCRWQFSISMFIFTHGRANFGPKTQVTDKNPLWTWWMFQEIALSLSQISWMFQVLAPTKSRISWMFQLSETLNFNARPVAWSVRQISRDKGPRNRTATKVLYCPHFWISMVHIYTLSLNFFIARYCRPRGDSNPEG